MRYESARHDSEEKIFENLDDALRHIQGSSIDSTRPWVRIAEGADCEKSPLAGSFLIVSGKKIAKRESNPLVVNIPSCDQTVLDAWEHIPKKIDDLLKEIDLCNNGYARLDCLTKISRQTIAYAAARGFVKVSAGPLGMNVVHRPELQMGVHAVERPASTSLPDETDWEGAILDRQERESMSG